MPMAIMLAALPRTLPDMQLQILQYLMHNQENCVLKHQTNHEMPVFYKQ